MEEEITTITVTVVRASLAPYEYIVSTDGPRLIEGAHNLPDALRSLADKIEEYEAAGARQECSGYPENTREHRPLFRPGAAA